MKMILYSPGVALAVVLLALPLPLRASEATIIGVYENCQPVSSTIIVSDEIEQGDSIVAQAESAGLGRVFDQALPKMIATLERNGIKDISIQRRGACTAGQQGQFVEAVVGYCDDKISRAEILVDGDLFFSRSGTGVDFETFIAEAREKLRTIGITDDPRVSLSSNVDCGPDSLN
jgi:hypothetical protein